MRLSEAPSQNTKVGQGSNGTGKVAEDVAMKIPTHITFLANIINSTTQSLSILQ